MRTHRLASIGAVAVVFWQFWCAFLPADLSASWGSESTCRGEGTHLEVVDEGPKGDLWIELKEPGSVIFKEVLWIAERCLFVAKISHSDTVGDTVDIPFDAEILLLETPVLVAGVGRSFCNPSAFSWFESGAIEAFSCAVDRNLDKVFDFLVVKKPGFDASVIPLCSVHYEISESVGQMPWERGTTRKELWFERGGGGEPLFFYRYILNGAETTRTLVAAVDGNQGDSTVSVEGAMLRIRRMPDGSLRYMVERQFEFK